MLPVESPFKTYTGLDGKPLNNGYVYFGLPNQNPITSPVTVYWDVDGTIPAAQPLRTVNGYIVRAGTPANVFIADSYSEVVRDSKQRQVFYAGNSDEFSFSSILSGLANYAGSIGSSLIGFIQSGIGAIVRNVQLKLRENKSFADFGAVGDGIADDWDAIMKAAHCGAGVINMGDGNFRITKPIDWPLRVSLRGNGALRSIISPENCDAFTFSDTGYDQDRVYHYGFGIFGTAGANYTGINCPTGTGVKYGIHWSEITISNMNQGWILSNNLHCSITHCLTQFVNKPVTLGDTSTFTRIYDNTFVYAGGTTTGSTGSPCGIELLGGSNSEAVKIVHNFIYGFAVGIKIGTVTDLLIESNGIDGCSLYGIQFTAVQYAFNIKNNFIELSGASSVACIYGAPLGAGEYLSQINIEGNSFTSLTPLSVGSIGILMNTAVDTFQWHLRIAGNVFTNMTLNDIRINLPGETVIENNRCMSVLATSLWIGTVQKAPVHIGKNWLKGNTYFDGANDVILGKVILDHNTESNTFVPYSGNWLPTFTASTGTFGSITYGQQEATFFRIGNVVHFSIVMYTTAVAIGSASGTLQISGFPFLPRKTTACALSDSRTWATGKNPLSAAVSIAGNLVMYSRATVAGDTVALTPADLSAVAGPANVITVSGSYICQ